MSDDQVINGSDANERLRGGFGDDTISGGGGNDLITSRAGNNTLLGGAGNDRIAGGRDSDFVDGGTGDDLVNAGFGDDTAQFVVGETGELGDTYLGGQGNDMLRIKVTAAQLEDQALLQELRELESFVISVGAAGGDTGEVRSFANLKLTIRNFEAIEFRDEDGNLIQLPEPNSPPQPGDNDVSLDEDSAALEGQLRAIDADGDTLIYNLVQGVGDGNGALILNEDGSYSFDPEDDFQDLAEDESRQIQFVYAVSDGKSSVEQTVILTITGRNDAPVALDDAGAAFTTDEDSSFQTGAVLANDSDVDGGSLSILSFDASQARGLVTQNTDGTFTYDPNGEFEDLAAGQTETDSFSYTLSDGQGGTSVATVTITIEGRDEGNTPPQPAGNDATTDEDTGIIEGQLQVADAEGDDLTFSLVSGVGEGNGTLNLSDDGSYSFDPGQDFQSLKEGEERQIEFTYAVTDGEASVEQTVVITVTGNNDAPRAVADQGEGFETDEDNGFTTASVLGNDSDPDNDPLSLAQLDVSETLGLVVDNGDGTFSYDPNGQFEALGEGETASDSFSYRISDGNGGEATATVTITIQGRDETVEDLEAPSLEAALNTDTGLSDSDGVTKTAAISGAAADNLAVTGLFARALEAQSSEFVDTSDALLPDGSFQLDAARLAQILGSDLTDGFQSFTLFATDAAGNESERQTVEFTLDRSGPSVELAPAGDLTTAPGRLQVQFDEPVTASAFEKRSFVLTDASGAVVEITSVDQLSPTVAQLNLASVLPNGAFSLSVDSNISDAAGNALEGEASFDFSVASATRVIDVQPSDGDRLVNLDRQIVVEFDRPVDPDSVTTESFQVIANGEALPGSVRVSSNGQIATFFLEEGTILPASTQVRVQLDGTTIRDTTGALVDVDGDGEVGGTLQADFSTVSLTRIPETNLEGFIFDSNNRGPNGEDLPLVGVIVTVVGLPGVQAVTDENGRFFLEDLPFPDAYLHFDASPVTAETGFKYGTIVKPVHTVAGQTVGMTTPDGSPFNIYFASIPESDAVEVTEGEPTEAGLGTFGLQNLTESFPDIDPAQWEALKVIIPEDSLFFDDGTPADSVTIMAFEPDRIPAPTPEGFDPKIVFTVVADGATNVDGKAQIEFPNLDGLAPGEKRPIMSFDHDAGKWVQTGTAIVSDDGLRLVSEGDTGVNTLGWKFVGDQPITPTTGPIPPVPGRKPGDVQQPGDPEPPEDSEEPCDENDALQKIDAYNDLMGELAGCVADLSPVKVIRVVAQITEALSEITSVTLDAVQRAQALQNSIKNGEDPDIILDAFNGLKFILKDVFVDLFKAAKDAFNTAPPLAAVDCAADLTKSAVNLCNAYADDECVELGFWAEISCFSAAKLFTVADGLKILKDGVQGKLLGVSVETFCFIIDNTEQIVRDYIELRRQENDSTTESKSINISIASSVTEIQEPTLPEIEARLLNAIGELTSSTEVIQNQLNDASGEVSGLNDGASEFESGFADLAVDVGNLTAAILQYTADTFYLIEYAGVELRGKLDGSGMLSVSLPAETEYEVTFFDYERSLIGSATGVSAGAGLPTHIAFPLYTDASTEVDTDEDGLVDAAEFVIGTFADRSDSDGDGILDGAEIAQGLNPLDGVGFPTGIIASIALPGEAVDIAVEGRLDGSGGQTAYIATGSHGLAILDASQFSNPILQGQIDLEGDNQQVAVDSARQLAYVAAGSAGLHIVDVSDPAMPQLVETVRFTGGIESLLVRDGVLFAGGRGLFAVNAVTGDILTDLSVGGEVRALAAEGDSIFAVVDNERLVSFGFDGSLLVELDSVVIPTPPVRRQPFEDFKIFIDDGVAYISNGLDLTQIANTRPLERGGYVTFDVSEPGSLELISNIDTPKVQAANLQTVTNGAGLAVVAAGQRGLQIHDASDPGNTYDLITEINTPGDAQAVALASGIAYVADGAGGLQVINFLPFDADGVAPTLSFDSSAIDADPDTGGLQVEEGKTIRLSLDVRDDVQVRNVELLLNGQVVVNDVSAPYELSFIVPPLSAGATMLEVQVRATDTGGNTTLTAPQTLEIIPDITPPELTSVVPEDGRLVLIGSNIVSLSFDESIDVNSIDLSDIKVFDRAAPAIEILPIDISFLADDQVLQFAFNDLPIGIFDLSLDLSGVTDRAGNPLGELLIERSFEVVDATAVWIDPAGGNWSDADNWRDGAVPTPADGVALVVDDDASVVHSFLTTEVERLRLQGTLELRGGEFSADVIELGSSRLLLNSNARLTNSLVNGDEGSQVLVSSGTFSDLQILSEVTVGESGVSPGTLTIEGGLTLDGVLGVEGGSFGRSTVFFNGEQTVSGTGAFVLGGSDVSVG
ncbi:cadherin-like domain-containing protein, partial [Denitrobaculum tricleocarpae]